MLALPITIIGDKFTLYYPEWAQAMGQSLDEGLIPNAQDAKNNAKPKGSRRRVSAASLAASAAAELTRWSSADGRVVPSGGRGAAPPVLQSGQGSGVAFCGSISPISQEA